VEQKDKKEILDSMEGLGTQVLKESEVTEDSQDQSDSKEFQDLQDCWSRKVFQVEEQEDSKEFQAIQVFLDSQEEKGSGVQWGTSDTAIALKPVQIY
jgi:hypothetical protein